MKKNNALVIASLLSLLLVSCGKAIPAHEHSFSDTWSNNESSHWHQATCDHKI